LPHARLDPRRRELPQFTPKVPIVLRIAEETGPRPLVVYGLSRDDPNMDTLIIETGALGARPTAVISADLDVDELQTWLGQAFHEIAEHLEATGNSPVGPPFARYHRIAEDRFRVEAGFPVAQQLTLGNGVKGSKLPGGNVAVTTHIGPYDNLEATYGALSRWLESRNATPIGDAWEVYFNGPNDPPSQWRTDIYQLYRSA
jgi:effector-binding domain-containing protein